MPGGLERKQAAERMLLAENQAASAEFRMMTNTEQWSGGDTL